MKNVEIEQDGLYRREEGVRQVKRSIREHTLGIAQRDHHSRNPPLGEAQSVQQGREELPDNFFTQAVGTGTWLTARFEVNRTRAPRVPANPITRSPSVEVAHVDGFQMFETFESFNEHVAMRIMLDQGSLRSDYVRIAVEEGHVERGYLCPCSGMYSH